MDTIFNDNPNLDVAYKTADGKYFYTENSAQNYALTLKNKEVKKVVRTEDATEKEEVKNEVVTETEKPQTVVTAEPSEPSENPELSESSEPSEETKPSFELKPKNFNKR